MPYSIRKLPSGKYGIVKLTTGEVVGTSDTKQNAQKSINARYAAETGNYKRKK